VGESHLAVQRKFATGLAEECRCPHPRRESVTAPARLLTRTFLFSKSTTYCLSMLLAAEHVRYAGKADSLNDAVMSANEPKLTCPAAGSRAVPLRNRS
jgi:hypothetical protein